MGIFSRLFGRKRNGNASTAEKAGSHGGKASAELEAILDELSIPAQLSVPRRINLTQQALRMISRDQDPPLWAALQVELGNALTKNPLTDRAANLE